MGKFLEFFDLRDIHKELRKTMKDKFTFIDEDIHLVLEELLAVIFHVLGHCCAEHHHLLLVGSFDEDLLDI
jgi:hypothetical protein